MTDEKPGNAKRGREEERSAGVMTTEERLRHNAVIALAIHFLAKANSVPGARQIERFAATITLLAAGEPRVIANKEPEIQEALQAAASVVANRAMPCQN